MVKNATEPTPSGVIVVELDDVVERRHPARPNLYVARTVQPLEQRFRSLQLGKGPEWMRDHIVALRPDLSIETTRVDKTRSTAMRRERIAELKSRGFTVNQDTTVWRVYVIELDPAAAKDPGRGVVYVGETIRTPEERFLQHTTMARTTGGKRLYSSVVAKHGQRLRPDLAPTEPLFDTASSKRAEAEWAEHLRSLGYVVKGGH